MHDLADNTLTRSLVHKIFLACSIYGGSDATGYKLPCSARDPATARMNLLHCVVPDLEDLRRRVVMSYQVREQLVGEMVEVMRYSVHLVK
jgi:hypothetical protein